MNDPVRDVQGVPLFRHEALGVVLQVRGVAEGEPVLSVLLRRREREPYVGRWALPSGPVESDESLGASVRRHLATRVDLAEISHLEQLETLGRPERDPLQRTIATAYLGLVPWTNDPVLPEHAGWFDVDALPETAFDHDAVIEHAVLRLQAKLSYTNIAFALAPAEFTMAELRGAYAAALGRDVAVTNLNRILVRRGQLETTGEHRPSGGGRPAGLFRFTSQELRITDQFATLRPTP